MSNSLSNKNNRDDNQFKNWLFQVGRDFVDFKNLMKEIVLSFKEIRKPLNRRLDEYSKQVQESIRLERDSQKKEYKKKLGVFLIKIKSIGNRSLENVLFFIMYCQIFFNLFLFGFVSIFAKIVRMHDVANIFDNFINWQRTDTANILATKGPASVIFECTKRALLGTILIFKESILAFMRISKIVLYPIIDITVSITTDMFADLKIKGIGDKIVSGIDSFLQKIFGPGTRLREMGYDISAKKQTVKTKLAEQKYISKKEFSYYVASKIIVSLGSFLVKGGGAFAFLGLIMMIVKAVFKKMSIGPLIPIVNTLIFGALVLNYVWQFLSSITGGITDLKKDYENFTIIQNNSRTR